MIPAYWNRAGLDHAGAARDWDTVCYTLATDVALRDRGPWPAPDPAGFAAFLASPHGRQLPVYVVKSGDGAMLYWTTHRPSADEYVRQNGGTAVYMGRKADL